MGTSRCNSSALRSPFAANIVEGCGAASPREFARFLDIAIKSASEVEYHLQLALDYGLLSDEDPDRRLLSEAVEIRKMLFGLRKAVLAGASRTTRVREAGAED